MNNTEKKLNSSYQKLKSEIALLAEEINNLKLELSAKGNVFYMENKYLGVNCMVQGVVVNGVTTELVRTYTNGSDMEVTHEKV